MRGSVFKGVFNVVLPSDSLGLGLSGVDVNNVNNGVVHCVVRDGKVSSLRSLHHRTLRGNIRFVTYRVSVSMVNIGGRRLLSRIAVNNMTACVRHTSGTGVGLFVWMEAWRCRGGVRSTQSLWDLDKI